MSTDPDVERVVVDGVDVTGAVRGAAVTAAVSAFASHPPVREEMRARQRATMDAAPTGCIAEGRDITTVVAPDAHVRVLLTADAEARVGRRARQVEQERPDGDADEGGDRRREHRGPRPRRRRLAGDVVPGRGGRRPRLDSSDLDLEQTVQAVLDLVLATRPPRGRLGRRPPRGAPPGPRRAGRWPGTTGRTTERATTVDLTGDDRAAQTVPDQA